LRQSQLQRCQTDCQYFLFNFVRTIDDLGVVRQYPPTEHITKAVTRWLKKGAVTVDVKSAQNMITWASAGVMVWEILFRKNIQNGYFSIGQLESTAVKDRCQGIIDRLPEWFMRMAGLTQIGESKLEIVIAHGRKDKSNIRFMHAGEKAGRSFTFFRVMLDEFAYMRNAEEIYNANKPRCHYLNAWSTAPEGKRSYFYKLYSNAFKYGIDAQFITYKENPFWTEEKIARVKRGMSDKRWRREMEGEFLSEGGRVYEVFDRSTHVVDPADFPVSPDWEFYSGTDFGYQHPFCHLWVAKIPCGSFHRWYIFHELYETQKLLRDLSVSIHARDNQWRHYDYGTKSGGIQKFRIKGNYTDQVSDAAGARERAELQKLGIRTRASKKGPDSVRAKIDLVRTALEPQLDDLPGLIVSSECANTIFEFENYMYKEINEGENSDDKPMKEWDHAMDVIGDLLITVNSKGRYVAPEIVIRR